MALAQDVLQLESTKQTPPLSVAEHAEILRDPTQKLSFTDVVNHHGFQKNGGERIDEPIGATYWLRFRVKNLDPVNTAWLLSFSSVDIFELYIYTTTETGATDITVDTLGNIYPFEKRPIKSRIFAYPFHLEPDEIKTFYIYIDHRYQLLSTKISLQPWRMGYDTIQKDAFLNGIIIGGSTIYLFASLILLFVYRRLINAYFIIYVIGGVLYLLGSSGFGFMYVWPSIPLFQDSSPYIGLALLLTGFSGLFRMFFDLDSNHKNLSYLFRTYSFLFALLAILFLAWPYLVLLHENAYYILYNIEAVACLTFFILSFWIGFKIYKKTGNQEYLWFLSVFVLLIITSLLILLMELTPLPEEEDTLSMLISFTIFYETTLLALFLIRRTYFEKIYYQKKIIEERERIVEDLHDEVISSIGGVKISMGMVKEKITNTEMQNTFHTLDKKIGKVLEQIRELSKDLKADSKHLSDLAAELFRYANEQFEMTDINLHLQILKPRQRLALPLIVRRNLKGFFKEAIHNCLKYSKAKNCWIQIEQSGNIIHCLIKDDGQGFNYEEGLLHPKGDGNGLKNLQSRSLKMGAEYKIMTSPGQGVEISLVINLLRFNQLDFALENIP